MRGSDRGKRGISPPSPGEDGRVRYSQCVLLNVASIPSATFVREALPAADLPIAQRSTGHGDLDLVDRVKRRDCLEGGRATASNLKGFSIEILKFLTGTHV